MAARESGQSLIEFVLMLPVMFGMVFILIRVNSAIQVSIVNQKYSRQRLLELAGNSPHYPDLERASELVRQGQNRLVVGVSDELVPEALTEEFVPVATTQLITEKSKAAQGVADPTGEEPRARAKVRIRNTVELCTPILSVRGPDGKPVATELGLGNSSFDNMTFCSEGV